MSSIFTSARLPRAAWAVALTGLLLVAGCSLAPQVERPAQEEALPATFDTAPPDTLLPALDDTAAYAPTAWWEAFGDATLNTLIDSSLVRNLTLRRTAAAVDELAQQYRIARAPLFPSITGEGNASRQEQPANVGIGGAIGGGGGPEGGFPDRFAFTTYNLSLALSYELDFWGRLRNQRDATLQQFMASVDDFQTARQQVIAQTVATYFEIATLEQQIRLEDERVGLLRERLELTEDRYDRGLVPSFELFGVRQEFEAARAEQPPLEGTLADARGRLAVLLGRFAGTEAAVLGEERAAVLSLDPIPAGLPDDLLMSRPDVRASARRLEARRLEIGVARARLLPRINLTAEGGVQSGSLDNLVRYDQRFTNLIAGLTAPLFQGGQLRAEVRAARARYAQAVASYEETLLTAFQEVRAALIAYEKQRAQYQFLQEQRASAADAAQTQRRRYERGIGDYIGFLDAQRALVQTDLRLTGAEEAVVNARIAVHRALGGAWVASPEVDDPRLFRDTYQPAASSTR